MISKFYDMKKSTILEIKYCICIVNFRSSRAISFCKFSNVIILTHWARHVPCSKLLKIEYISENGNYLCCYFAIRLIAIFDHVNERISAVNTERWMKWKFLKHVAYNITIKYAKKYFSRIIDKEVINYLLLINQLILWRCRLQNKKNELQNCCSKNGALNMLLVCKVKIKFP